MCPLGLAIFDRGGCDEGYDEIKWSFPDPDIAARRLGQTVDECEHVSELWDEDRQIEAIEEAASLGLFDLAGVA